MDASRTHEQIQGQPVWLFVAIGVVVLVIAALSLGVGMNTGEDVATYPAGPAVAFDAGAATRIHPRAAEGNHYAGAFAGMRTGPREGGEYAGASPAGTPTAQTIVRERPVYAGPHPGKGACNVKQQCG